MGCALSNFPAEKLTDRVKLSIHQAARNCSQNRVAGILWWDGDGEGAIDAYTAADEVLAERMQVWFSPLRFFIAHEMAKARYSR